MPVFPGTNAGETLTGTAGDDTIQGMGGDDIMIGGAGADAMDGGSGSDTASYVNATTGVTVFLANPLLNAGDAAGDTYVSVENITGSDFADIIGGNSGTYVHDETGTHTAGPNRLDGGAGNDFLYGNSGDHLIGGTGADHLSGGTFGSFADYSTALTGVTVDLSGNIANTGDAAGDVFVNIWALTGSNFNDSLYGDSHDNILEGMSGDDVLSGFDGGDAMYGGAGVDTLTGGNGDDLLEGGAGADTLDGGSGVNTISFAGASGVTFYLDGSHAGSGDAAGDVFTGFTNIVGSFLQADVLHGDSANNEINGLAGGDTIFGEGGNDILTTGGLASATDVLYGGAGDDVYNVDMSTTIVSEQTVTGIDDGGVDLVRAFDSYTLPEFVENGMIGGLRDLTLTGNALNNSLSTQAENTTLIGGGGDDVLNGAIGTHMFGGAGNDILNGGENSYLAGGAGADQLIGDGTHQAIADYRDAATDIIVFAGSNIFNTGDAAGDTLANITSVYGSSHNDILGADSSGQVLSGQDGNDWLVGNSGSTRLFGDGGNDVLVSGSGADDFRGGDGIDVVSYRNATAGITFNMSTGQNAGDAIGDTIARDVEYVWGSEFNDTIINRIPLVHLNGYGGDDTLSGYYDSEFFYGGTGADTITTDAGVDDIFYLKWADEGGDTITDFAHGTDHITLSRYWFGFGNIAGSAAALTSTDADFITTGTTAASAKPTFFWNDTTKVLEFDPDGTGVTAAVTLATLTGATLTLSDIWAA